MNKLKSEKGSITLFVLIAMLFFVLFLTGMYMLSQSKQETGISQTAKIKQIYEKDVNNIDDVYATYYKKQITVNAPNYKNTGLIPVTIREDGSLINADTTNEEWYSYDGKQNHWANAKTKDGSMFVWIPRFAYKINQDHSIDVVFLKDTSNLDFKGNDVTSSTYIDEKGKTGAYIVHPAFEDGSKTGFPNGEWRNKISGFWMAKFEAGYDGNPNDPTSAIDSEVTYSTIKSWNGSASPDLTSNYYGERAVGTKIKYPVFMANKPGMNHIGISDSYDLCQAMSKYGNPYGLKSNTNSHLTKNSEWGAVAYLTQSKYGRNGEEVTINNISLDGINTVYAVTGYAGESPTSTRISTTLENIKNGTQEGSWESSQGQNSSTTGNIYGIYDLSGGLTEWTAGYIESDHNNYINHAGNLKGESNEYKSKYAGSSAIDTENYLASPNPERKGEAIWETSTSGTGSTSWNSDGSGFAYNVLPFFDRGGTFGINKTAGIFRFHSYQGYCVHVVGFRPVLIIE